MPAREYTITTPNNSYFTPGMVVGFSSARACKVVRLNGCKLIVRDLYWYEKASSRIRSAFRKCGRFIAELI